MGWQAGCVLLEHRGRVREVDQGAFGAVRAAEDGAVTIGAGQSAWFDAYRGDRVL